MLSSGPKELNYLLKISHLFIIVGMFLFSLKICSSPLLYAQDQRFSHCSPPSPHNMPSQCNLPLPHPAEDPLASRVGGGGRGCIWGILSSLPTPWTSLWFTGFVFRVAASLMPLGVCHWAECTCGGGVPGHAGVPLGGLAYRRLVRAHTARRAWRHTQAGCEPL